MQLLCSELFPTVWDSFRRIILKHAITILLHSKLKKNFRKNFYFFYKMFNFFYIEMFHFPFLCFSLKLPFRIVHVTVKIKYCDLTLNERNNINLIQSKITKNVLFNILLHIKFLTFQKPLFLF